jgi:hypothetical protein
VNELLSGALDYARLRRAVFPLEPRGKKPLTTHGLHDATSDVHQIRKWWRRWPQANIGLPTGRDFDVLDVDDQPAAMALQTLMPGWPDPAVPAVQTARGCHYYFPATHLGSRTHLLGVGLDFRGLGGYVVAPPSVHRSGFVYRWRKPLGGSMPPPPRALWEVLDPPKPSPSREGFRVLQGGRGYGYAALVAECERVRTAPEGCRNDTLNRASFNLGQLVGAGLLDLRGVAVALWDAAAACGLPESEAERTIESGLNAGMANPRRVTA